MERKDIAEKYKWKLSDVFPSDEAWEAEYAEIEKTMEAFDVSRYQGKLADKATLLAFYRETGELNKRAEKLYVYAHMSHDQDLRVSKYNAYMGKISTLFSKFGAKLAFVDPELTALSDDALDGYINDPDFASQEYMLRLVKAQKAHVLTEGEEKLLALVSDVTGGFRDTFMMLDNANLNLPKANFNGAETQMSHGTYGLVMHTGTREERKEWFEKYYEAYVKLIDAITQTYIGNVKKDIFYTTARKYGSCLERAMHGEDVDIAVYNNLVEAVNEALPQMHRYIRLRKDILGLEEQHMYDVYAPLVEDAELKMPFEEAYETVIKGLAPLGESYAALLRKGRDEGWIDVMENDGKRSGAYSTCVYATHPYVLLNYQQTMNDIFTVAHEMGHAIHSYQSNTAQPYEKADYTIFVAEIASTVNEVLLLKHLYANTQDKKLKKYLLNYYLDMMRATLFRQTQFAQFEQRAHAEAEKGNPLTKESLCEMYYELNQKYYGDGLVHDKQIAYEWARIPHFYTAFYVYKYATGITSAISIVQRILTEGEPAVKDYFTFLQSGGSTDPVSILKRAGVDLTTKMPFERAMKEFEETLDELAALS